MSEVDPAFMQFINSPGSLDPSLMREVARYAAAGVAANTRRTYLSAWRSFESWCSERKLQPLPAAPLTCAAYLADRAAMLRAASLSVHAAAIAQVHQSSGLESPTTTVEVTRVLKGIRRELGTKAMKKRALEPKQLKALILGFGDDLRDLRDKALLLLGFCTGCRRAELVGLDVEDVVFRREGALVTIRRSKTDQEGVGRLVAVEYGVRSATCPVSALEDWLSISAITSGPLFRAVDRHGRISRARLNGRAVARVLQRRAEAAGLEAEGLAGHSLRSGLATAAAAAAVGEREIAERTGHRNLGVLRGYVQTDPFAVGLTRRLGL
jgi:integrase